MPINPQLYPESEVLKFLGELQVINAELITLFVEGERETDPLAVAEDGTPLETASCIKISNDLATQLGTYLMDANHRLGRIIANADSFRQGQQSARALQMLHRATAGK